MELYNFSDDQLKTEYKDKYPLYEKLCSELVTQIHELISEAKVITTFPIESRVKTWDSIHDKFERYHFCPQELGEISDIAGLRIILLFKRDLNTVCEIIEQNFAILRKENTHHRLGTDQFGYESIHYELTPPESWLSVPTLRRLGGLRAEVQVRTASQHIWAAASHILQYKREKDVPFPFRRSINRVAALLEIVDLEFERVLYERGDYIQQIANSDENETLNTDSLRQVLDRILPEQNKEADENYAELLEDLRHFNIATRRELEDVIKRNWDEVIKNEEFILFSSEFNGTYNFEREGRGVFSTHVGLVREALANEFPNFWDYQRDCVERSYVKKKQSSMN